MKTIALLLSVSLLCNFNFIIDNGSIKLDKKQLIKVLDKQKIGAYNQPSSASSIDSYSTYSYGGRIHKLDIREDILLSKQTSYYLGDQYNHFLLANKKNLLRMFSSHENIIEKYLKENAVDFNNEEDLKKLIFFLQQL